jgi:hypothetical protein
MYLLRPTGGHGGTTFEDASWRTEYRDFAGTPVSNFDDRKFSAGPGATDFDGSTDYFPVTGLCLAGNCKNTGWTIEWWESPHVAGGNRCGDGGAGSRMYVGYTSGNLLYISSNGGSWDIANARSLGTIALNVWTHRAICWTGSQWYIFENGVQIDTWASSLTPDIHINSQFQIGRAASGGLFNGLMEDFAVWRKAKYTAAFIPPTAPITP